MSIHFQNEKQFEKWRKRARVKAEHSPEDAPVIMEILSGMERLEKQYTKLDKRIRTLESQVQKAYAQYMTGGDNVE